MRVRVRVLAVVAGAGVYAVLSRLRARSASSILVCHTTTALLLHMCPHTATYMCPHTATYVNTQHF